MTKCSSCGHETLAVVAGNAEREIVMRIPERHFALFRKTFREMEVKLGMHGLGELANQLKPYGEVFSERWDYMRYFDDGAIAMCMTGVTRGYEASVRVKKANRLVFTGEGRVTVHVEFLLPDGKTKSIEVAEVATPEASLWFAGYFDDVAQRLKHEPFDPDPDFTDINSIT